MVALYLICKSGIKTHFFILPCSVATFGYTGEYTGDSTDLVYLRARYYAPSMGRFLTKDTWDGNYYQPLTMNGWNYTTANPINYVDSSGLSPCQENGGGRYCALLAGGYIDIAHFRGGKTIGENLYKTLRRKLGKNDSELVLQQSWFPGLPQFSLTYTTSLPTSGLTDPDLNRIALGIFMDFQIRYETFQGIDPRCYIVDLDYIIPHCSSFSNEDLVSDYLGFSSYMKSIKFDDVIEALGGGVAQDSPPTGYFPVNQKFTWFRLMVADCGNITIIQRPLPQSLLLDNPIEAGVYWDVPKHFGKIDLSSWL